LKVVRLRLVIALAVALAVISAFLPLAAYADYQVPRSELPAYLGEETSKTATKTPPPNPDANKPITFSLLDAAGQAIVSNNAQFELKNASADGTVVDDAGAAQSTVTLATSSAEPSLVVAPQKPGSYVLSELQAPRGYRRLAQSITLTVDAAGVLSAQVGGACKEASLSSADALLYAHGYTITYQKASSQAAAATSALPQFCATTGAGGTGAVPLIGAVGTWVLGVASLIILVLVFAVAGSRKPSRSVR